LAKWEANYGNAKNCDKPLTIWLSLK